MDSEQFSIVSVQNKVKAIFQDNDSSELSFDLLSLEKFLMNEDLQVSQSNVIDHDVGRISHHLDEWTDDLKKKYWQNSDKQKLKFENASLKDLLVDFEKSLDRKDEVISQLSKSLQNYEKKICLCKMFTQWRLIHVDSLKEKFQLKRASKHYNSTLLKKTWKTWFSLVETHWKKKLEKVCTGRAQEICLKLSREYEVKIANLVTELGNCNKEKLMLQKKHESYKTSVKEVFMRSMCALNGEAMCSFTDKERSNDDDDDGIGVLELKGIKQFHIFDKTEQVSSESIVHFNEASCVNDPHATTTKELIPCQDISGNLQILKNYLGCKQGLPISSVVVERHQPLNNNVNHQLNTVKNNTSITLKHQQMRKSSHF